MNPATSKSELFFTDILIKTVKLMFHLFDHLTVKVGLHINKVKLEKVKAKPELTILICSNVLPWLYRLIEEKIKDTIQLNWHETVLDPSVYVDTVAIFKGFVPIFFLRSVLIVYTLERRLASCN